MYSGDWAFWFSKHFGRALDEKRIPEWVYSTSKGLRAAFIDGLLSSDGYQRRTKPNSSMRREIVTAKWRLASDICRLLMSVGRKPCLTRGSTGQWSIQYTDGQAMELIVRSIKLRLPDKKERVFDLAVEESQTFVVGTATVHNCHRIGQKNSVLAQHVVLDGSLDVKRAKTLIAKQEVIERGLDRESQLIPDLPETPEKRRRPDPSISQEEIANVHACLQILSTVCDGAVEEDGMGFNGCDTRFGKQLAAQFDLTPRQAVFGKKMIRKYRRQLPDDLYEKLFGSTAA